MLNFKEFVKQHREIFEEIAKEPDHSEAEIRELEKAGIEIDR